MVVHDLIGGDLLKAAYDYASLKADAGLFESPHGDVQVPGAPGQYADPLMEVLLARCTARLSVATGFRLVPTYSYCRVFGRDSVLHRHTDRRACEFTASVCLGYQGSVPSPLFLHGPAGTLKCVMYPGDALVYLGCTVEHWRQPWEGVRQAQVFLHYVDRDGKHAHLAFDGRQGLGLPAALK